MEKSKDVKLQGVTCTKLSTFLNVNKQLGEEKEIEGESMIEEERDAWKKSWDSKWKKRERPWLKKIVEANDRHEGKVCGEEEEQDSWH